MSINPIFNQIRQDCLSWNGTLETQATLYLRIATLSSKVSSIAEQLLLQESAAQLTTNTDTAKRFCHLNLGHPLLPPAPLCPAYGLPQVPTVTNYHTICSNYATIRLQPQNKEIPEEIRTLMKDKETDLFFTLIHGGTLSDPTVLLSTHRWVFGDALPSDERDEFFPMSILPIAGIKPSYSSDALSFGTTLTPKEVHMHLPEGAEAHPTNMLYSPLTATFEKDSLPFSLFWAIVQKDNRLMAAKMLVIYQPEHPLCRSIFNSFRGCTSLNQLLERLVVQLQAPRSEIKVAIDKLFASIDKSTLETLPESIQHEIFYQIWTIHGSPMGIHPDFGKASFYESTELASEYHSSDADRMLAIDIVKQKYIHELCNSLRTLLTPIPSALSAQALALIKTAEMYMNKKPGDLLFQALPQELKDATYGATWALTGYPRDQGLDYGQRKFFNSSPEEKAQALLYASSKK